MGIPTRVGLEASTVTSTVDPVQQSDLMINTHFPWDGEPLQRVSRVSSDAAQRVRSESDPSNCLYSCTLYLKREAAARTESIR